MGKNLGIHIGDDDCFWSINSIRPGLCSVPRSVFVRCKVVRISRNVASTSVSGARENVFFFLFLIIFYLLLPETYYHFHSYHLEPMIAERKTRRIFSLRQCFQHCRHPVLHSH